ncbi:FAD-dependent oxidoreductase [bacterium]|nr:FAD-dependent oxidoreductase [bacterium]
MSGSEDASTTHPLDPAYLAEPLIEAVPGQLNPAVRNRYNLVVLGGGPVGFAIASNAAALGAKVAVVEKGKLGEITFRAGAVSTLALARAARQAREIRRAGEFGIRGLADPQVDFAEVMRYVRAQAEEVAARSGITVLLRRGIDVYEGEGKLLARTHIEVSGHELEFSRAVIATGSRPNIPPVPGLKESGYLTGDTLFTLAELPRRLAIVGAGTLGCELAQCFARLGSRVFVYDEKPRCLSNLDADAAEIIRAALEHDGVTFRLGYHGLRISRTEHERVVHAELDGKMFSDSCDHVLVAAGRIPMTDGLDLDAAGIRYDESGVWVNSFLRTTNLRVLAAGNVCSDFRYGQHADTLARVVVANALFYGSARLSGLRLPVCVFTDPEVAHVGLDQKTAEARRYRSMAFSLDNLERALIEHSGAGLYKLYYDKHGRLRSAVIVADHASELIGELVTAMNQGVRLGAFASNAHPTPTLAEIIQAAGDGYRRNMITPFMARFLRRLLSLRR